MALSEELKGIYEKALSARDEILSEIAPLREKEDALRALIAPIKAELNSVLEEIAAIERDKNLADVSRTISALAPNATRMKVEGGTMGIKTTEV